MIELQGVSKHFGEVVALSDVSITIGSGVTALLGPNGAGKSTLFRVLAGLCPPTSGSATVMDRDLRRDVDARGLVGLVPQQDELFEHLSARSFLELNARLCGVRDPATAAQDSIERVQLIDAADRRLSTFSKGMRQRVKIAAAVLQRPPVLLLDEPLNGLDPVQRGRMIELFRSYADAGATVVVSSHVLEEVAEIGSQVVVLVQGRLAATGDFRQLRQLMNDFPRQIEIITDKPRTFAAILVQHEFADGLSIQDDRVIVQTTDLERFQEYIARVAYDHDLALRGLSVLDDNLEAVFNYLTGTPGLAGTHGRLQ